MSVFTKYKVRKLFLMLILVSGVLLIGHILTRSPSKSTLRLKSGPASLRYQNYNDWIVSRIQKTETDKKHQWEPQTSIDWEKLTFYDPTLEDSTTCADSKTSVITIRNRRQYYKIGDTVLVEITLKDLIGRRKSIGGDVVRIFVTTQKTKARAIASVLDGHNGAYIGVVKLLWAGEVIIQAKMCTPRELISLMYNNMRMGKTRRPIQGNFTQAGREVTMDCTALEQIANRYKEVCNLTHRNADLPWYCEKPKGYSCDSWETHYPKNDAVMNLTEQEIRMISSVAHGGKIPMAIPLTVFPDRPDELHFSHKNNIVPCNKLPKRDTWNTTSPVGYMYNGTWYSTQCRTKFDGSKASYEKCLTESIHGLAELSVSTEDSKKTNNTQCQSLDLPRAPMLHSQETDHRLFSFTPADMNGRPGPDQTLPKSDFQIRVLLINSQNDEDVAPKFKQEISWHSQDTIRIQSALGPDAPTRSIRSGIPEYIFESIKKNDYTILLIGPTFTSETEQARNNYEDAENEALGNRCALFQLLNGAFLKGMNMSKVFPVLVKGAKRKHLPSWLQAEEYFNNGAERSGVKCLVEKMIEQYKAERADESKREIY